MSDDHNHEEASQRLKDNVQHALQMICLKNGMQALSAVLRGPEEWAKTPSQSIPAGEARSLAALNRLAPGPNSDAVLNRTWMETDRELAKEYVDYMYDQFALWAMSERPDLLRTGREILNDSLPADEQI